MIFRDTWKIFFLSNNFLYRWITLNNIIRDLPLNSSFFPNKYVKLLHQLTDEENVARSWKVIGGAID